MVNNFRFMLYKILIFLKIEIIDRENMLSKILVVFAVISPAFLSFVQLMVLIHYLDSWVLLKVTSLFLPVQIL